MIINTDFPDLKLYKRGKVRDVYDLDDKLLIIATDRISAFDVVLNDGIPNKGIVLNELSCFWFNFTKDIVKNHLITNEVNVYPLELKKYADILRQRSMLVKKTKPLPVECIVRGYISGSAWKEYLKTGSVSGIRLPQGLKESEKLPEPIFTPSTKAETGHDENITEKQMIDIIGKELTNKIKDVCLEIYQKASHYAESKGIIIADTKMEFGLFDEEITLIDELLTPDSSRFWDMQEYQPGKSQNSFDKQFIRDYLESINWDKRPPAPKLPDDVIAKTQEKYQIAYKRIIGK
ncbi:MAG: phosphoribosylaminoimidazolesuccinocarboxamide synthase [candidate division WOR-3 bacterium]|nr:phosphoribosylaminoimidazolesuccinocarboxamide synthase [candidate division WOR-3 bacterium]